MRTVTQTASRVDHLQRQTVSTYSANEAAQSADMGAEAVTQQRRCIRRVKAHVGKGLNGHRGFPCRNEETRHGAGLDWLGCALRLRGGVKATGGR